MLITVRAGRDWSVQLGENQRTCSWKAVRLFGEVMTAMEAYGVTVVAGESR